MTLLSRSVSTRRSSDPVLLAFDVVARLVNQVVKGAKKSKRATVGLPEVVSTACEPGRTRNFGRSISKTTVSNAVAKHRCGATKLKQTARVSSGGKTPGEQLKDKVSRKSAPENVTRCGEYVMTKRKWEVMYLSKKCFNKSKNATEYYVHWFSDEKDHAKWERVRTWEPESELREDGLGEYADLVDRYLSTPDRPPTIKDYMSFDEFGQKVLAMIEASEDASCGFLAVKNACGFVGLPFSEEILERFLTARLLPAGDTELKVKWKVLFAFVKSLVRGGTAIDLPTLSRNLITRSSRFLSAIFGLNLADGVYLVGTANHVGYGHGFVVVVGEGVHRYHDDGTGLLEDLHWIAWVYFVRRFQVYEPHK